MSRSASSEVTDTRSAILEEAIRVIDEQGEASVHVRDIVAAVGVASTSLYHFFGSREDLLDFANAERYRRSYFNVTFDATVELVAKCRTKDELKSAMVQILRFSNGPIPIANRRIRAMVLGSAQTRPLLAKKIAEINAEYGTRTGEIFRVAQERGWVRAELDLQAAALWVMAQMSGRILVETGATPIDVEAYDRAAEIAVFTMLFGEEGSQSPQKTM